MEAIDELVLIGLSHLTADAETRERYAVAPEDTGSVLRQLTSLAEVDEAFVVSTCNRTEVLVRSSDPERAIVSLRSTVFRNLATGHVYAYRGVRSVMHLFRVAAGLDSLVLGESEILGQIRRGVEHAEEAGSLGQVLRPLTAQAMTVGKRARSETSIGEGSLSVARVGIEVASRVLGSFEGRHAVVVGAGETGLLAARHLLASGIGRISLLNRTLERAEDAAAELGERVTPFTLEALGERLAAAELGIVAVDGAPELIAPDLFDRRALARRDQPLVLIDLSIPRAVHPATRALEGVLSYDLDALLPVVEENKSGRAAAMDEVGTILVGEVHKFLSLRTFASFSPAIEELKARFRAERERLIDRVTKGEATARELELAHAMERQFLALALSQMKESARSTRSEAALDRVWQRFQADQERRRAR